MIDKEKLLKRRKKQVGQIEDKAFKKVYCLYRVSNNNQVDDDDIPMQKKACHEFAAKQNMKYDLEKENEDYDNLIMLIPKSLMHPEKYSAEVISKRLLKTIFSIISIFHGKS